MKKLNRKGFTLIELLAVIVILAIIVVVTVPTIINTIADARVQSIWNLAGSTANSYDTMKAQDLLATDKVLDGLEVGSTWKCIGAINKTKGEGENLEIVKKLTDVLDLSATDIKLDGSVPTYDTNNKIEVSSSKTCSAIRLNSTSNGAEVLLVANTDGKFDVSGENVWALSTEDSGHPTKGD